MRSAAETLDGAADLIQFDGWTQGEHRHVVDGRTVGRCAIGAIYDTTCGDRDEYLLASYTLSLFICGDIADWNDASDRTSSDVIDTMRHCAKALREVGAAA